MNPGNFYNPYLYTASTPMFRSAGGLLSKGLLKGASWNGFLTTAGKTLNVINQAIPIFYQVRPIIHNAKTMFRVLGAVKTSDQKQQVTSSPNTVKATIPNQKVEKPLTQENKSNIEDNGPTFFL